MVTAHLGTVTTAHESLKADYAALKDQLDWFKRQLFGRHSEKRLEYDLTEQVSLFEALGVEDAPASEVPTEEISYRRRRKRRGAAVNDSGLRFNESVPVTTIEVKDPGVEAIPESERVLVGENVTCRLAQERASYRVLRYVLPVVKRRDTGVLVSARAPANVLARTTAAVSLLAGMLVDKFRHHLPLHRQYRRMAAAGIVVNRSSLTNWEDRAADLLAPVAAAQTAHVLGEPRPGDGRDADQRGLEGAREDEPGLLLADLRGGRRDRVPVRGDAGAPSRGGVPRGVPGHAGERRLRGVRALRGEARRGAARAMLEPYQRRLRAGDGRGAGGCGDGAGAVDGEDQELAAHIALVGEWVALPETAALQTLQSVSRHDWRRRKNGFGISVMTESTVLMALYAFIKSPADYLTTVERAIRAGGDIDTTAAIAGAISGAYNGVSALPDGLAGSVKDSDETRALGEQLYRAWAAR